ncbi:hypothetical protein ACJX0J_016811, partial [Zea mays]
LYSIFFTILNHQFIGVSIASPGTKAQAMFLVHFIDCNFKNDLQIESRFSYNNLTITMIESILKTTLPFHNYLLQVTYINDNICIYYFIEYNLSIVPTHGIGVVIFYRRTHGTGVVIFYVSFDLLDIWYDISM